MRHVLCFGDSNTHGTPPRPDPWHVDRMPVEERWPTIAGGELGADWHLIAEGQPGRTTVHPDPTEGGHKSGLAALPVLLESHRPLDVVVIMLGTNDLKQRFAASATDVALGVERLVECIRTSNAGPGGQPPRCLVIAPVPITEAGISRRSSVARRRPPAALPRRWR